MRYSGQSFELTIPAPANGFRDGQLRSTVEEFHREHQRTYGFAAPNEPTELVTVRVAAVMRMPRPRLRTAARATNTSVEARVRPVYFDEAGDFVHCTIYDRYALAAGLRLEGPAIVEELDSTCVLHPGYTATIDDLGNLLLTDA